MAKQDVQQTQDMRYAGDTGGGGIGDLRGRLDELGESAADRIDNAPLIALAGGIALGALIAAVLPQPEQETRLLSPVGTKVGDAGRGAIDRARERAQATVDELAGDKVRDFFGLGGKKE